MSHASRPTFVLGVLLIAVALFGFCGTCAAGQSGPGTSSPAGQDYNPEEHTVVSGVLRMKKEGDKKVEGEAENVVGYISSGQESYKVTSPNDKILADLKERDGKKIAVEGKLDAKTNTIAVSKILEGVLPPSENRNPRGLD